MHASPTHNRGFLLSARPVLALDLGGTQIRAAIVLPDGARIARVATETPTTEGAQSIVRACADALLRSREAAPREVAASIPGIGISAPGPIDPFEGIVLEPPNLGPEFRDIPLAAEMERELGLPAYLDRDTNIAALGEMAFGAALDCLDFLYITVSTGIGGAIVSKGRLFHGPDGVAGELGHVPVAMDGPRCGCGGLGHLEAFASGTALARDAREVVAEGRSPFLDERVETKGLLGIGARDVAEGDAVGDLACVELMNRARHAFAVACVGFVNAFNPSLIIVGGSIAEHQGDRWLAPARAEVALFAFRTPARRVEIVEAKLASDVSLAGAYPLVTARLGDPTWRRGRPELTTASVQTAAG